MTRRSNFSAISAWPTPKRIPAIRTDSVEVRRRRAARTLEALKGVVALSQHEHRLAKPSVSLGVIGRECNRCAIAVRCVSVLPLHLADKSEVQMEASDCRSDSDGALEARGRFGRTALGEVTKSEIVVRTDIVRAQMDRLLAHRNRFSRTTGGSQLRRQLIAGFYRTGVDL